MSCLRDPLRKNTVIGELGQIGIRSTERCAHRSPPFEILADQHFVAHTQAAKQLDTIAGDELNRMPHLNDYLGCGTLQPGTIDPLAAGHRVADDSLQ
jgi:hypothetical protein